MLGGEGGEGVPWGISDTMAPFLRKQHKEREQMKKIFYKFLFPWKTFHKNVILCVSKCSLRDLKSSCCSCKWM